jgi:hypothetical protein
MTYRGRVKDGMIVLEDSAQLPEGAEVRVEFDPAETPPVRPDDVELDDQIPTIGQRLLKLAGKAKGLPVDAARNHDHYLYGTPKR